MDIRDLNFRQITYFLKLAETQHMAKTAEDLMMSPAAMSNTLKHFEEVIGMQLFDRVGRNIVLNEYGTIVKKYANELIYVCEEMQTELKKIEMQKEENYISIGLSSPKIWTFRVTNFFAEHPNYRTNLEIVNNSQISNPNELAKYDLLIGAEGDFSARKYASVHLADAWPMLVVNSDNDLAEKESVDLTELKDYPFILTSSNYSFRSYTNKLFEQAGFKPKVMLECENDIFRNVFSLGYGVSLSTDLAKFTDAHQNASYIEIHNPKTPRRFYVYWEKTRELNEVEKELIDYLKESAKEFLADEV